jgi:hypothetical protein
MSLIVRWPFSIMGNRVISRSPSRTGFDLSSLEDEPAEEFVRGEAEAEAGQGDREAEAGQEAEAGHDIAKSGEFSACPYWQ